MKNENLAQMLEALPEEFPGFSGLPKPIQYLMGCGNFQQFIATYKALTQPDTFCPFCEGQEREETYISGTDDWTLRHNEFPALGTKLMLLIVPRRHITDPQELTGEDALDFMLLFTKAIEQFDISGGALVMRFGDPQFHSGTVPHLHFNVIWPSGDLEYRVALSKSESARENNYARLLQHRNFFTQQGGDASIFSSDS